MGKRQQQVHTYTHAHTPSSSLRRGTRPVQSKNIREKHKSQTSTALGKCLPQELWLFSRAAFTSNNRKKRKSGNISTLWTLCKRASLPLVPFYFCRPKGKKRTKYSVQPRTRTITRTRTRFNSRSSFTWFLVCANRMSKSKPSNWSLFCCATSRLASAGV